MQKVRCHIYKLQQIICNKFQVLLNLLKFFFTFPSRYLFTIGYQKFLVWGKILLEISNLT